jgi:hypothetical protein
MVRAEITGSRALSSHGSGGSWKGADMGEFSWCE